VSFTRTPNCWVWIGAAIAGVIGFVWLALLVRVPAPRIPPGPDAVRNPVGLVDPVAIEGTMLFDLTPLFLPTQYNSSRKDYVPSEPGAAFTGFPARLTFAESGLELHLPPAGSVPDNPAEALVGDPPGAPFIGFGRKDLKLEPLPRRGAYVEIVDAGSGRRMFGQPVADAHPPSSAPWKPMEFIAAVDPAGLVGPVVPTVGSGVGDVDDYFGRYLEDTLRVGQRLAPGFYRISVGP
jgi:hypothetical protein